MYSQQHGLKWLELQGWVGTNARSQFYKRGVTITITITITIIINSSSSSSSSRNRIANLFNMSSICSNRAHISYMIYEGSGHTSGAQGMPL